MPPVWVSETFAVNDELLVETSNPSGAVTVMLPRSWVPLTVKDWAADGVPKPVVKLPRLETDGTISAVA